MRRAALPLLLVTCLGPIACNDDEGVDPVPTSSTYDATIRRTSYGIPHVTAADLGSLGFGIGHAGAEDYACILSDQILKVRSERAQTFGAGEAGANIESDFAFLGLGVREKAEQFVAAQTIEMRQLAEGFVAGYNLYLEETGTDGLPAPCKGAAWVKPITLLDLASHYVVLGLRGSSLPLLQYILKAAPPGATSPLVETGTLPDFRDLGLGSNGWALGSERTESGKGMLVANPHFPWEGELKFYESHLTVPGVMDVYGASLLGLPVVNIGFNAHVGWTHTVTPSKHFTVYELTLAEGDPSSYVYDGETRPLTKTTRTVTVLGDDGTTTTVSRDFYRSHYGPMAEGAGLSWTNDTAFTYRDANEDDTALGEVWLRMNLATSVEDLVKAQTDAHGIPWVYTMAADDQGHARLLDSSRVPDLSAATVAAYEDALVNDATTGLLASNGVVLLDGSTSRDEWVSETGGLVPATSWPQLDRTDYVLNANDAPWLANIDAPIVDYPMLYGAPEVAPSPRTQMNHVVLTETGAASAAGADGKFSLDELSAAILNGRGITGERLRDAVVLRCKATTSIVADGTTYDLTEACSTLEAWDLRYDLDSKGAVLWREVLGDFLGADFTDAGKLYATPFDPVAPLTTPRDLAPVVAGEVDLVLTALGRAVGRLTQAGLGVGATLREAQITRKGEDIPVPGGGYREGVTNIVGFGTSNSTLLPKTEAPDFINPRTGLSSDGYLINNGSSFIMALELTDAGPRARAMLTYAESSDPASPHYADQTALFSEKAWRPVLFTEAEIAADPALTTVQITAPRAP